MSVTERGWMYRQFQNGNVTTEFLRGVDTFIKFACSQPNYMNGYKIKCPCKKCKCKLFYFPSTAKLHLTKHGFMPSYYNWVFHGEPQQVPSNSPQLRDEIPTNRPETVVLNAGVSRIQNNENVEEAPNPQAEELYSMLDAASKELYPGCTHSQLSFFARILKIKSEGHLSEKCFNELCELIQDAAPKENCVLKDFDSVKMLFGGMGLPVEEIHCCRNSCMLFWGVDANLSRCKFCDASRYKDSYGEGSSRGKALVPHSKMYYFPLTPRLQRLYASRVTANEMRWHASSQNDGKMHHPADSPAWKHLDQTYPDFAAETRNVRLGLSASFQPFEQSRKQYSSWPVIITPYNLPPSMCMKEQVMFLTVIVPGPQNPKEMIDVYLQPLIVELKHLWEIGVPTYDVSLKQNFQMRAALLWTISDFPVYSMLLGWSTAGRLACPHCMSETEAFTLPKSGKECWFDNHRRFLPSDNPWRKNEKNFSRNKVVDAGPPIMKTGQEVLAEIESLGLKKVTELSVEEVIERVSKRQRTYEHGWRKKSIFWDLPYWSSLLVRHNLDVMHIEKNIFDNIFNTIMNVKGKTKDTRESREELNTICDRPELRSDERTGKYPKAAYMLDNEEKRIFCKWIEGLEFPDGYASNLGRCVNLRTLQMCGMKSHDCHIMLQRIMPVGFRELLPPVVWNAITSLCLFFKALTSPNIKNEEICRLHDEIATILSSLEHIFPPSFFDLMEHLPIHLAHEARLAGPVQYRWMYPFERYLGKLKKTVRNEDRVEGLIANAYLAEECSNFCSYYFEDHIKTRQPALPQNHDGQRHNIEEEDPKILDIFKDAGRPFGESKTRFLAANEYAAAHLYVLSNCDEVGEIMSSFIEELKRASPKISKVDTEKALDEDFPQWFKSYVANPKNNVLNIYLRALAQGPLQKVRVYSGFFTNGFKFNTVDHGSRSSTYNSGVWIKGSIYDTDELDYYGHLLEVVELEYPGACPIKRINLFKCEWFDPTPSGTYVHPQFKLVSVNHTRRLDKYEPFVLAKQASQVYFCAYPSKDLSKKDWWAVCNIRSRPSVEVPDISSIPQPFQDDEHGSPHLPPFDDDVETTHPDGGIIEIEEGHEDDDDEVSEEVEFSSDDEVSEEVEFSSDDESMGSPDE